MKRISAIIIIMVCLLGMHAQAQVSTVTLKSLFTEPYPHFDQNNAPPLVNQFYVGVTSNYPMKINSLDLIMKLDFGERYLFGYQGSDYPFQFDVTLKVEFLKNLQVLDNYTISDFTITVNNSQPEALYHKNLDNLVDEKLVFNKIRVTVVSVTETGNNFAKPIVKDRMRLNTKVTAKIGEDLSGALQFDAMGAREFDLEPEKRQAVITFHDDYKTNLYEVQLLKLENYNPEDPLTETHVHTKVDWKKATVYELRSKRVGIAPNDYVNNNNGNLPPPNPQPDIDNLIANPVDPPAPQVLKKSLTIPIGEGRGIYLYRFRAISALEDDGYRHEIQFSPFSAWPFFPPIFIQGEQYSNVDAANYQPKIGLFYFDDPDKDVNWQHNMYFDETHSPKESVTYATSLTAPVQTAIYLPSENTTLINSQYKDYEGRQVVQTLQIPLEEPGKEYQLQNKMITADAVKSYNPNDFDKNSNFQSPAPNKDNVNTGYFNNNPDPTIPNAEGFPFKRDIIDNMGRIVESSGIGKTHSIGDQANGQGRTNRIFYSVPADDELVRLFGDEAPKAEKITKITSIDANNVATISYVNEDNEKIATCLSFSDEVEPGLVPLDENDTTVIVTDKVTRNETLADGFRSSKKLVFTQPTTVTVDYALNCTELEQICTITELDCDFTLFLNAYKMDQVGNVVSVETHEFDLGNDNQNIQCQNVDGVQKKVIPTQQFILEPFTNYVIEKHLVMGDVDNVIKANNENVNLQTDMAKMVGIWISTVACEEMLPKFWTRLEQLETYVNNNDLENFPIADPNFPADLIAPLIISDIYLQKKNEYAIQLTPNQAPYTFLEIKLPCCDWMTVDVLWLPDICSEAVTFTEQQNSIDLLPTPYSATYTPNQFKETEIDFEGIMMDYLADLEIFQFNGIFNPGFYHAIMYHENGPMAGWNEPGMFNMMIHHMLKDRYNCANTSGAYEDQEGDTYIDGCGNEQTDEQAFGCDQNGCNAYRCEDLLNCWIHGLKSFREFMTNEDLDLDFDPPTEGFQKIEDALPDDLGPDSPFDDEDIDGEAMENMFEDEELDELEKNSDNLNIKTPHLVEDFFRCVGYQFARIIHPLDLKPLPQDELQNYPYGIAPNPQQFPQFYEVSNKTLDPQFYISNPTYFNNQDQRYYYVPLDWNVSFDPDKACSYPPLNCDTTNPNKPLFRLIYNPLFAYKYYHYDMLDYQIPLEISQCFRDPNDCYQLDNNGKVEIINGEVQYTTCCGSNPQFDANCHPDYDYPMIDSMQVGVDPGVELGINNQKFKYIVNEFCGEGRIKCPYDHRDWDCGQRFNFYMALKEQIPIFITPSNNAPTRNCNTLNTIGEWYFGPDVPDIVSKSEKNHLAGQNMNGILYQKLDINGNTLFTYFDFKVFNKMNICSTNCDQRRWEIRNDLVELLIENCYQIGGCFDGSDDAVVTNADLDQMVDALVEACKEQCNMTTYGCQEIGCRSLNVAGWDSAGVTGNSTRLEFGMGGTPNGLYTDCYGNAKQYEDNLCLPDINSTTGLSWCPIKVSNMGQKPEEPNYSWYEYTLTQQANRWFMELSIPSKCQQNFGDKAFSCCVPDNNPTTGDTYLEKQEYELEIELNVPLSDESNNGAINVYSPAKAINIQTQP